MRILNFNQYSSLFERINPITANWSIVTDESSFTKKPEGGYFVFNQKGNFVISYMKNEEEARLNFFFSKDMSPDKKSLCECSIIKNDGKTRNNKLFQDIKKDNIWEIISVFFDYCDLEKSDKNVIERFLMGFSKGLIEIMKHDEKDNLPSSFKYFYNIIADMIKENKNLDTSKEKDIKIVEIIKDFAKYFNKLI
jgi:hypothetical protein